MGKEVVQGILTGLAFVVLFVATGSYIGANLGHGGGHGGGHAETKQKSHNSSEQGDASKGDQDESSKDGHGQAKEGGHEGSTGWGGYLLGLLLHVLFYGIPSYIILGLVALSEYFDRRGFPWWSAYIPGYNAWIWFTRQPAH